MTVDWQLLIVVPVIAVAGWRVIREFWPQTGVNHGCPSGCGSCPQKQAVSGGDFVPLTQLTNPLHYTPNKLEG